MDVEESPTEEKEVIVKSFIPKERKDPTRILRPYWFCQFSPDVIKHLVLMLEWSYEDQKKRWETEERISKQRKEYLQNLYDKLQDVKIIHANNQKK